MTDPIQTVREALVSIHVSAADAFLVGQALAALEDVEDQRDAREAVVKAAREMVAPGFEMETGTALRSLHQALTTLDPTEAPPQESPQNP